MLNRLRCARMLGIEIPPMVGRHARSHADPDASSVRARWDICENEIGRNYATTSP